MTDTVDTSDTQGLGNTNTNPRYRSRNYCFTVNNYTEEDIKKIEELDCKYVFQEETGAKGTPHLQGILMFKNAMAFNKIKEMLPRGAHIEKTKNKKASIKYCSKEDTRSGEIYSNIDISGYTDTVTQKKKWKKKIDRPSQDEILKMIENTDKSEWRNFLKTDTYTNRILDLNTDILIRQGMMAEAEMNGYVVETTFG